MSSPQAIVAWASAPARPAGPCRAACAGVEAIGPVSELVAPAGDPVQQAAMTFAHGRWYVAWSGQRTRVTMVQRFSADGRIEGPALRIDGMAAGTFAETASAGGDIELVGWVAPAYSPEGARGVVHRLTPDLEPIGVPVLLRGPGAAAFATNVVREDGRDLVSTGVQSRQGMLVREVRLPADASVDRPLAARDWRPGVEDWGALERVGGQPYFLDGSRGALRIRALRERGVVGPAMSAFPIPTGEGRQALLTRRIGDRWYVGAHAARSTPIVRVRAVDASSLAPAGPLIELLWPSGGPSALIDAGGTPMLLGSVETGDRTFRPSLVPLDFVSGASCSASTLSVPSLIESYQAVRAIHFEGGRGAAVIAAWGMGDLVSRAFFTPLRCASGR